jgi:colanic acid/amylovoran biosynthesis glycosyltransferase
MSEDMKNDLIKLDCPVNKIKVHYHGTDVQKFSFPERAYKKNNLPIFLLQVARLVPLKGQKFLIASLSRVFEIAKKSLDIRLRLIGEGTARNELLKYAAEKGIYHKVDFLGMISYATESLINEYRKADIFIHPSVTPPDGRKEGIPGTIVEAMASGLPVISTYHAGIPYIIQDGYTGILVKEWDIESLANAILKLVYDTGLREYLGRNAQKYATENLDIYKRTEELENIYDILLR